jgi:L-cysteine:1D-myo-inositol 2-amino-2-deoxy-alpha-D-glucopyranoside ligase
MQLFNTQSGQIEAFAPRDGKVGLYVCGITPYDTTHIGHAFTFLTFDILVRHMRHKGWDVTYVQNVTDIDDDILRKAKEVGLTWRELGDRETERYLTDMRNLNALPPDHYVRATDNIPQMLSIIQTLIDNGHAYASDGNVYFAVDTDPEFGKLSHIPLDTMLPIANERGNTPNDPHKRNPLDAVLWQKSAEGEPAWDSPWGSGRPGWHIECSAMASRYLGPTIDIHGGGSDLVFPHHEFEIAQSENAFGVEPFARIWAHVAMVGYNGEKMSKSLGNLVLAGNVLQDYSADAIRLYLFSHHYREPWAYEEVEVDRWAGVADDLIEAVEIPAYGIEEELDVSDLRERFFTALDDDLNTPLAIEIVQEIAAGILESPEEDDVRDAQRTLREVTGVLGLTLTE